LRAGVLLLMLCMALTPVGDGFSKSLGAEYSPFLIVCIRYFLAALLGLAVAAVLRIPIQIPTDDVFGTVFRTSLVMGAMTLLIFALSSVTMAKAVGGFLIAPVVASLLAVVVLRERFTAQKIVGSTLSFAGAIAIMQPETDMEFGSVAAICGGVLLGAYLVAQRYSARGQSYNSVSVLVVQCLLGSAMLAPFAYLTTASIEPGIFMPSIRLGAVTAACHFLTVAAYQRADASILSPFLYFNLISACVVGYVVFGEVPSFLTLLALACVALGGWITVFSSQTAILRRMVTGNIQSGNTETKAGSLKRNRRQYAEAN
jgi:drug/metabolite transporter (DMT)-like permease